MISDRMHSHVFSCKLFYDISVATCTICFGTLNVLLAYFIYSRGVQQLFVQSRLLFNVQ